MAKWIDCSPNERRVLIDNVVKEKNIDEAAAEKDWWVTAILFALSKTSIGSYILFKGGTSLSKGWNIISRFSEDIDIVLDRRYFLEIQRLACARCRSNTQIHNLREKSQDFIFGELKNELVSVFAGIGLSTAKVIAENEAQEESNAAEKIPHDKDPSVLLVRYPSLYTREKSYAMPIVKIEISCLSMTEPFENKEISSLVQQVNARRYGEDVDSGVVSTIKTVSPARTFLEKAFLLSEEFQKNNPRSSRMSRHLYDLEKLSHTSYMPQALSDGKFYLDIIKHRERFYHPGYVDYSKDLPEAISFVPEGEILNAFKTDYAQMCRSFIYEENPLSFEELIKRVAHIQEMFRNVPL